MIGFNLSEFTLASKKASFGACGCRDGAVDAASVGSNGRRSLAASQSSSAN